MVETEAVPSTGLVKVDGSILALLEDVKKASVEVVIIPPKNK